MGMVLSKLLAFVRMGNQIYGLSSSQVVGCEECMQDLQSWVKFEEELSGSRLFKVAKVRLVNCVFFDLF